MRISPILRAALYSLSLVLLVGCENNPDANDITCLDGDQTYTVGDNWTCSDGCNACSCGENGSITSTDLACSSGECTPEDCGPALGMPNYLCEDGVTTAGPGDCEIQEDGTCGWTVIECPETTDPCDDLDCEPCVNGECIGEDELCEPGETFDAADGCNTCECPDSGLIAEASCTEMACDTECGADSDCTNNQFCDFSWNECGLTMNTTTGGMCMQRPEICDEGGIDPGVCGCSGRHALNDCELQAGGTDLQKFGGCLHTENNAVFICGTVTCNAATEVCNISINDIAGDNEPEFYSNCSPRPDSCDQGDCSCMEILFPSECLNVNGYTTIIYPGG